MIHMLDLIQHYISHLTNEKAEIRREQTLIKGHTAGKQPNQSRKHWPSDSSASPSYINSGSFFETRYDDPNKDPILQLKDTSIMRRRRSHFLLSYIGRFLVLGQREKEDKSIQCSIRDPEEAGAEV